MSSEEEKKWIEGTEVNGRRQRKEDKRIVKKWIKENRGIVKKRENEMKKKRWT